MEDEEGIGLVLARATELRLKIGYSIHKATTTGGDGGPTPGESRNGGTDGECLGNGEKIPDSGSSWEVEEDEERVAERLLHIRDALESLESQLTALQNLRQRQQYEKQVALSEIDYSRKMLLERLKDYTGKDLEVIHETSAFAGERVEDENDLVLPPYAIRPPLSLLSDNNAYVSLLTSKQKSVQNGLISSNSTDAAKTNKIPSKESQNRSNGIGIVQIASSVAKIALPIIGVISVLSVTGQGSEIRKRCMSLKLTALIPLPANEEKISSSIKCPPGKVLVVENGKARCLVKERVEIPFETILAKRDVSYGYG